jgi:hypothetical protein
VEQDAGNLAWDQAMNRWFETLVCAVVATALTSCESPPPEYVWVSGAGFEASVSIELATDDVDSIGVGEWVELRADRRTGPWVRVPYRDLAPNADWMWRPPPAEELGVQASVTWRVSPPQQVEFNLPNTSDLRSRRVRFNAPGTYTLWARGHDWAGGTVKSNELTITVAP